MKNEKIYQKIRLLNQYNRNKLKELEKTLSLLIQFARDDLKKLDELEKELKGEQEDEK